MAVIMVSLITNCTKEQLNDGILTKNSSNDDTNSIVQRPVIDFSWVKYVGNWKLTNVTDNNGKQLYYSDSLHYFSLLNDLYVDGNFIKGTIWRITTNNHLQILQYPYNKYDISDKYAVENDFEIVSIASRTLVLSNYILDVKGKNILYNNIYYFTKE